MKTPAISPEKIIRAALLEEFSRKMIVYAWLDIKEYPHKDWDYGPDVLLAWMKPASRAGPEHYDYGVGCSHSYHDDDDVWHRSFRVGEWDCNPTHFAYLSPPK